MQNSTTTKSMEKNKIIDNWLAKYGNNPEVDKIVQERLDQMTDKEVKQTVLTELLHWVRRTLPMDLDYPQMIEIKIESLILKEKFQIMDAYYGGNKHGGEIGSEKYYNKTYGEEL